ncbi:MAG: methylated-DNA--[protein]-cysteine S-methyltransferase, partial [Alphaproteobacteria bacterium]|nr:methylated-DNA--[protein]-cysteine S-methyltransferase [Alphaproteobacteria bacterium]
LFGKTLVMATERGLCGLAFLDERGEEACLNDMVNRWPKATIIESFDYTKPYMDSIFRSREDDFQKQQQTELKLFLKGTEFQVKVWQALMSLPKGSLTTYGDIARRVGLNPSASRAVGTAIGMNPVGWIIPCHRVIRNTGYLGGYRWGLPRKLAMIGYEATG